MRAGVDIGGTFTDLCIAGPDGIVAIGKALGTPAAPADSVETVLREALEREAYELSQVVHATTLVTNALIERKGARVALLATAGFRDVMELARERRPDIYRLDVWRPEPLVPRHLRFDIAERTLADGTIEQAVDADDVAALAAELAERGIEAIAICFLHSFANADNERAARAAVARAAPDLRVAISSDVAPEIREYERTQTTAASVYVQDRVVRYLEDLEQRLTGLGAGGRLRVMLSNGGVATARDAADRPIRMLESGSGRRCARGRAVRGAERLPRPDVVRHGRHDRQAVPDRGRPPARHARVRGRAHGPVHARVGPADQDADDRHDRDRRRRRVARARRHARAARVRAGVRGRRPRPRVLRRRRDEADRDRRRPRARLPGPRVLPRRRHVAGRRGRAGGDPRPHRRPARAVGGGGGVGHPPPRQRGHGQRRARARRRARPRRHRPAACSRSAAPGRCTRSASAPRSAPRP